MADTTLCARCSGEMKRLPAPPIAGSLGTEIQARVCASCWQEWEEMEVKVINELRLNFMDPEAQQILQRHLREFLALPDSAD